MEMFEDFGVKKLIHVLMRPQRVQEVNVVIRPLTNDSPRTTISKISLKAIGPIVTIFNEEPPGGEGTNFNQTFKVVLPTWLPCPQMIKKNYKKISFSTNN